MFTNRYQRLLDLMNQNSIDFVAINPGYTFKYLTQLDFHLMERPVVLLISKSGKNGLILPHLEVSRAEQIGFFNTLFPYGDNPKLWNQSFLEAAKTLNINTDSIAVEPTRFRYLEYGYVHESCPHADIRSGASIFDQLRIIKDDMEIMAMEKAAKIAESALLSTLTHFKPNMTEKEMASELIFQCLRSGADSEFPFAPIVAAGPNSANPHATPSEKQIAEGEVLLFDWGVCYQGYAADITRCFSIKYASPKMDEISKIVLSANKTGRETGKPGIQAGDVDIATRNIIVESGFGQYFTHRTGHGLGMEGHESPYIYAENNQILEDGMVYTVEPGIYLPNIGGIRIEDNVVVTKTGSRSLTNMDRDLIILGV